MTPLEQDVADIKASVDRLAERIEGRFDTTEQRQARLEGGFAQMDKRLGSLESLQRWALGMYAVPLLVVLGLYFKG